MSRSYKRYPIFRIDKGSAKRAKSRANRHFRRCPEEAVCAGKSALHRKFSESWSIHDDFFGWTHKQAETDWEREAALIRAGITDPRRIWYHHRFRTKHRFLSYWAKHVLRK